MNKCVPYEYNIMAYINKKNVRVMKIVRFIAGPEFKCVLLMEIRNSQMARVLRSLMKNLLGKSLYKCDGEKQPKYNCSIDGKGIISTK